MRFGCGFHEIISGEMKFQRVKSGNLANERKKEENEKCGKKWLKSELSLLPQLYAHARAHIHLLAYSMHRWNRVCRFFPNSVIQWPEISLCSFMRKYCFSLLGNFIYSQAAEWREREKKCPDILLTVDSVSGSLQNGAYDASSFACNNFFFSDSINQIAERKRKKNHLRKQ